MLAFLATSAFAFNLVEIGDSNARSTRIDVVKGGLPVENGFSFRDNGTMLPFYPAGNLPGVGKMPYFVELAIADGDTSGWVARRGTNGAKTSWPGTIQGQWNGLKADVLALGGEPDVMVIDFGANDSNKTLAVANAYHDNMARLIDEALALWPDTLIVIARETTSDPGALTNYVYLRTIIYDAIDDLDAEYGDSVEVADGRLCDRVDAIHWSVGGTGGGQECVANLIFPLWVAHSSAP